MKPFHSTQPLEQGHITPEFPKKTIMVVPSINIDQNLCQYSFINEILCLDLIWLLKN